MSILNKYTVNDGAKICTADFTPRKLEITETGLDACWGEKLITSLDRTIFMHATYCLSTGLRVVYISPARSDP